MVGLYACWDFFNRLESIPPLFQDMVAKSLLYLTHSYYLRQGGNVFAGFCLFVCL